MRYSYPIALRHASCEVAEERWSNGVSNRSIYDPWEPSNALVDAATSQVNSIAKNIAMTILRQMASEDVLVDRNKAKLDLYTRWRSPISHRN